MRRSLGANDRVRVGIVGCGDRMKGGDLPAFQQNAKDMNFQIVAVSDIWNRRREEGAAFIEKLCGNRPDRSATMTNCMRAKMSMPSSSPPPISNTHITALKP